jgi:hypothetical protein
MGHVAMRRFNDLDAAIDVCERGVATHRRNLENALHDANGGLRRHVASPKVLLGTVFAGYLFGQLTRRSRTEPAAVAGKAVGVVGVLGGLALSLLRAQLGTPGSWLNEMLMRQMRSRSAAPDSPTSRPSRETHAQEDAPHAHPDSSFHQGPAREDLSSAQQPSRTAGIRQVR